MASKTLKYSGDDVKTRFGKIGRIVSFAMDKKKKSKGRGLLAINYGPGYWWVLHIYKT
jgi:hypothetical protein